MSFNKVDLRKNFFTIFTGNVLAQGIPILLSPILTRIYSPEDFGVYGVFLALTTILGVIANLQFTQAILIEKDDDFSINTFWLTIFINLIFSSLLFLVILFFKSTIAKLFNIEDVESWLLLLPLSTFFGGVIGNLNVWFNRKRHFKITMYGRIIQASVTQIIYLYWGYTYGSKTGLFLGFVFGLLIYFIFSLTLFLKTDKNVLKKIHFSIMLHNIKRHAKFPLYYLPSELINALTNQLPTFFLNSFFTPTIVGFYTMSNRVLGLPMNFISSSVGEIFKSEATSDFHNEGNFEKIFKTSSRILFIVGLFPLITIVLFGPFLFGLILGEEWRTAGEFSQILCLLYFVNFVVDPLTYSYFIRERQKEDFALHILLLVTIIASFYFGYKLGNIWGMLLLYSINRIIIYLIYYYRAKQFSKATYSH